MKYIINDQVVLSRPLEGPLAAPIASFAQWAREQGYALYSLHRHVLLAAGLSRWLGHKGVAAQDVVAEHPAQYLRYRARRLRIGRGDAFALQQFMEFLRGSHPAREDSTLLLDHAGRAMREGVRAVPARRAGTRTCNHRSLLAVHPLLSAGAVRG